MRIPDHFVVTSGFVDGTDDWRVRRDPLFAKRLLGYATDIPSILAEGTEQSTLCAHVYRDVLDNL